MAKGYSIAIASDTKAFATGVTKGIIEPLEDAAEILQDIGSEGGRDLDKLERAMKDAQDKTDDVKQAFSALQQEIRETGRKARTDFADPTQRAMAMAGENVEEFRDEARANLAETFSSFDGSLESLVDGLQGTLGGVSANLKGIPAIAAAAAGAAGLGLIVSNFNKQLELTEELKAGLVDAYKSAAAEGRAFLDQAQVDAAVLETLFNTDKRNDAQAEAERIGVDLMTYIRGQAGDIDALNTVVAAAKTTRDELLAAYGDQRAGSALDQERASVAGIVIENEKLLALHSENQRLAEEYVENQRDRSVEESANIARVRDAEAQRWDEAARRYDEAAARPPIVTPVTLQPDESALDRALARPRTLKLNIEGMTRNGQKVI